MGSRFLIAAFVLALASPVHAGNLKYHVPLVSPASLDGTSAWDNDEVVASFQLSKCRTKITVKDNGSGLRGKDLVCILSGDSYTNFGASNDGASTVYRGTVDAKSGKMVAKADDRAIGCGLTTPASTTAPQVKCYEDTSWNAAARCLTSGAIWVGAGTLPGTSKYKAGAVVGACSGTAPGFALTPPAGADTVLSESGYATPCKTCP